MATSPWRRVSALNTVCEFGSPAPQKDGRTSKVIWLLRHYSKSNPHLQFDLFDERNLITLTHDDYPGERLVACRNPALAKLSAESAMT